MTPEEKSTAKAAAVAAAKAVAQKKLAAKKAEQEAAESMPPKKEDMTDDEKKQAAKAAAIAAAKAKAAALKEQKLGNGDSTKNGEQQKSEKVKKDLAVSKRSTRVSKKMAWSIILFVIVILGSSSALAMKVFVWNGYDEGTKLEKHYRDNIQKLKENPDDLDVRYDLLVALYNKGLLEEARGQLEYILNHAEKDSKLMWKSMYYKALYASLDGDKERAIQTFNDYLKKYPNHGEAWLNIGFLYYSIGDYDKAAGAAGKAGVFLPDSPDIPYLYGILSLKDSKVKEAKLMFEKALELDANHQKSIDILETL